MARNAVEKRIVDAVKKKREQADALDRKREGLRLAAEDKARQARCYMLGEVILTAMKKDDVLDAQMRTLLDGALTAKPDASAAEIKSLDRKRALFGLKPIQERQEPSD